MISLVYDSITYQNEIIAGKGSINMQHAMVGETLSVDSVIIPIMTDTAPAFTANAPGLVYDGATLIGKYYLSEMHQTGPSEYELTFLSAVKLLDQSKHVGGMYSGTAAGTIIAEIMGSIDYSVDDNVADALIYEYLPYDIKRNNLQKLLMAIGGAVRYIPDGSFRVTSLSDVSTGTFGLGRVFEGGTLIDKSPASGVQVTEHNYIESTEEIVLFSDASVSEETVIFTEPIHDLTITGGSITASGVNFCTFTGAGSVLLKGQRYQHVTRVILEGDLSGRVMSVAENTLLSPYNATEVAERLYAYLTIALSIKSEVILGTERPGDVVSVIHPYTKTPVSATIKTMDIEIGRELRAVTEFLVGYIPPSLIAGFEHYAVLTGTDTWTVPAGVTRARLVLGGGGNGGNPGANGSNAGNTEGGVGGAEGTGGEGGLILEINTDLTPGANIDYACAVGGNPGSPGDATTFGAYSSAIGRTYPYGYTEPKSSLTLSSKGIVGQHGGKGATFSGVGPPGDTYVYYKEVLYQQGANGAGYNSGHVGYVYGGRGGGPAAGYNGGNGEAGDDTQLYPSGTWVPSDGKGGTGANAVAGDDATEYGQGGQGGHGGGGGGAGKAYVFGGPGIGGTGSAGGKGGPGVIIIYY